LHVAGAFWHRGQSAPSYTWLTRRETTVHRKSRKTVRIELTEEQKKAIREQTGEDVETVELTVEEELEQRVTPRTIGTFF
jgi:hypothetical protein